MLLRPRSLIARILLAELGAIAVVAVLLPALMIGLLRQQMNRYEVKTLKAQASEIALHLDTGTGLPVLRLPPALAQTYATPYDGRAYVIADAQGHSLAESAFARVIAWQQAPLLPRRKSFRVGSLVGVSQPITTGPRAFWIIVMQDERGPGAIIDDVTRAFATRYGPVLAVILLLLPLLNSLLVRRLVVAVRAASDQAGTIGPQSLDLRLDTKDLPQEIAPLAKATNDLLVRLQQSFDQQSEFVANVAHELRTPLTTLKFELETLEDTDARDRLGRTIDRLTHVIAQLQALAALETAATSFAPFDAQRLAEDVISEQAPAIFACGDSIALVAPADPIDLLGNRTLIGLALANLIANASRHTPPGTAIEVRIGKDGAIHVSDDGPGIASSDPGQAKLRYWRADNRRSDSAGLGLSIVARIVEVHGGRFTIESPPGAGAALTIAIPLDSPSTALHPQNT